MKGMNRFFKQILLVVASVFFLILAAHAAPLKRIKIVKIAPMDETAVVKIPGERELKLIKVGDTLGDKGGVIKEIAEGRIVIEEGNGEDKETVIIRVGKEKQTVQRVRKNSKSKPPWVMQKHNENMRDREKKE